MMSLEEAIEHAEDIAISAVGCECREEHRQLAAWLRELQERRKEPEIIKCVECKHSRVRGCVLYCAEWMRYTSHNGYCHRGRERRIE